MGWFDSLKSLVNAIDTEYDRRVRAASNVKQYQAGGHGNHHDEEHDEHPAQRERLQGEGGEVGELQTHAGPQSDHNHDH